MKSYVAIGLTALLAGFIGVLTASTITVKWRGAVAIEYVDFISIVLSALSVLLTALGILIAIMAYIGWRAVGGHVGRVTESYLEDKFREGQPLYQKLQQLAKRVTYSGVEAVTSDPNPTPTEDEEI